MANEINFEGKCTGVAGGKQGLKLTFAVTSGLLAGREIASLMAAAEGEGQRIKGQLEIMQENLPFAETAEPGGEKDGKKGPPKRRRRRKAEV